MKKIILLLSVVVFLLTACSSDEAPSLGDPVAPAYPPVVTPTAPSQENSQSNNTENDILPIIVFPLPNTSDDISNCTTAISLQKGGISTDSDGTYLITATLFTYDIYDADEIELLKAGDTIIIRHQSIAISSISKNGFGTILINGGLDLGGCELRTDDDRVYYEIGYSDVKSWQEIGQAVLPVSPDFVYTDRSNLDAEPLTFTIQDFLSDDSGISYHFTPHNTSIVIENGIVISMERVYTP